MRNHQLLYNYYAYISYLYATFLTYSGLRHLTNIELVLKTVVFQYLIKYHLNIVGTLLRKMFEIGTIIIF